MGASITVQAPGTDPLTLPVGAGEALWLSASGERQAPGDAQVCIVASGGAVWAIVASAIDDTVLSRGRPVMGGMIDLLAAPLTVGEVSWTARHHEHGPRPTIAGAASDCPVCHLPIASGDEVLACSCGAVTDSRFCAMGGAADAGCFACGTPLTGGMSG